MFKTFAALCFFSATAMAAPQEKPPAHFDNWGVCPFECCSYRDWTADDDIAVHANRSDTSPVLFQLHPGEALQALTGVVVTEQPAIRKVEEAVQDGYLGDDDKPQLALKPGEKIYELVPLGEGAYRFWYHGKVYQSGIAVQALPTVEGSELKLTWWKMVRNSAGQHGWTRSDKFQHMDACG